jgi:hypothetical protein
MDSLFLKLPRELRDRIYYFVLGRYANWPGITDDNHFYVIGHSPDAIPFGPTNPESHRMVWGWIFTSKQMFSEARAQSRRDARLVSKNHSMYRPNDDRNYHTGLPNSKRSFSFAEPEQVEDWSIDTRIRQCQSLHRFDQTGHDPSYPSSTATMRAPSLRCQALGQAPIAYRVISKASRLCYAHCACTSVSQTALVQNLALIT